MVAAALEEAWDEDTEYVEVEVLEGIELKMVLLEDVMTPAEEEVVVMAEGVVMEYVVTVALV